MLEKYLIVGLGLTGVSVARFLASKNKYFAVTDTRQSPPNINSFYSEFPKVKVFLGSITIPADTTHIVLSPGIAIASPEIQVAISKGIKIIGDIELFAMEANKPVIAITGSNGKSTTTALLAAMALEAGVKVAIGGNFGTPALDLLEDEIELYILELSSFQLETTYSLQTIGATILNISSDHMDRYSELGSYIAAKKRIYLHAKQAVVNRSEFANTSPNNKISAISFALDTPSTDNYGVISSNDELWLAKGEQLLLPVKKIGVLGAHNIENSLAALALGEIAGLNMDAMLKAIQKFNGLEHRCESVLVNNDIVWVNDSKGTNVGATVAALHGLGSSIAGKWVIILGGQGKNADFMPLISPIAKYCKAAILIGDEAVKLNALLETSISCYIAKDMQNAVTLANKHTNRGDGVLFSPACASFDMFTSYIHRGKVFKEQVLQSIGLNAQNAKVGN